jgi:tetratricopeptide (TPR) repeat protein
MSTAKSIALCTLALLIVTFSVVADDDLAELKRRAEAATGKERLGLLNQLAEAYTDQDPEQQIRYGRQALELARQLTDAEAEARALFAIGGAHLDRNESEALDCFSQAGRIYERLGNLNKQFDCIKNQGWAYENLGDLEQAGAKYEEALQLARSAGLEKEEAVALQCLGVIRVMSNQLDTAVDLLLQALAIQERIGDKQHIANIRSCLGSVYCELGDHGRGLQLFQEVLQVYEEAGHKPNMAIALMNIGIAYRHLGRPQDALVSLERSLAYAEEIGNKVGIAQVMSNLANIHADLQDLPASRRYDLQALEVWREVGNMIAVAGILGNLGEGYLQQGEHELALRYTRESLQIAEELNDLKQQQGGYNNLSEIHGALGNYRQALADYRKSVELGQQIINADKQQVIAGLEARYEAESKKRQIELLEKDLEIQRLQLQRARLRTIAIFAGFIVLAGLVAVFFRRYLHLLAFWKKKSYISHYKLERQI